MSLLVALAVAALHAQEPEGTGMPNDRQWTAALAKPLSDRFALAFHHEQKELPAYALTVSNTRSKMTKNDTDPNGLQEQLGLRLDATKPPVDVLVVDRVEKPTEN